MSSGPTMMCGGCGVPVPWNPFRVCGWVCYDRPREDPGEHEAMLRAAPEAFGFFMGLGPGEQVEE